MTTSKKLNGQLLIDSLQRKLGCNNIKELNNELGLSIGTFNNWRQKGVTAQQIATAISKAQTRAEKIASCSLAENTLEALRDKLGLKTQDAAARHLGLAHQTLINWKDNGVTARKIADAFIKAQAAAISKRQIESILPVVELFPIAAVASTKGIKYELLTTGKHANSLHAGLRKSLESSRREVVVRYHSNIYV